MVHRPQAEDEDPGWKEAEREQGSEGGGEKERWEAGDAVPAWQSWALHFCTLCIDQKKIAILEQHEETLPFDGWLQGSAPLGEEVPCLSLSLSSSPFFYPFFLYKEENKNEVCHILFFCFGIDE